MIQVMENNNDSRTNIVEEITDSNYSLDLNNSHHDHSEPTKTSTKNRLKKRFLNVVVIQIVICLIITVYTILATVHFVENTDPLDWDSFNKTTSKGYGLLIILYLIYIFALTYHYVIKPFLPQINEHVWSPLTRALKKIPYGTYIFYVCLVVATLVYLVLDARDNYKRLIPLGGLLVFILVGFALSAKHKHVPWHTLAWGLILQFIFGFLTIRWEVGRNALGAFSDLVNSFLEYGVEAAVFTYGNFLVNEEKVFAFNALSVIFFFGFIINILYYYGLMQRFVNMLGKFLQFFMGTSICESVNSVAVAFFGMSEGPMMLQPYLKHLTDSELHSMMLAGFASVSGSTLAAYISFGARAQDLITASIMSAPAALCYSKLLYPETEKVKIKKEDVHAVEIQYSSAMDAASKGATDAFHLIAAIISGVTATLAFVYFINGILTWLGMLVGFTEDANKWTLDLIAGKVFIPVAYIMGVEERDCEKVGQLIGIKTMVNEFLAFSKMGNMTLQPRSKVIATYAICGFSNPSSIGILIATMAALVPEKKENVARLIFRAWIGGALVCFMTACVAGLVMTDAALSDLSVDNDNSTLTTFQNLNI